jgi:integrase/recombinase XerD
MVTYKLALDERRAKQDGTFPLVIRVTFNRKVTAFQTGIFLKSEHWDKSTLQVTRQNPNWPSLNLKVSELYVKIQKIILALESEEEFSFEILKERLSAGYKPMHIKHNTRFEDFTQRLIDEMLSINKAGNAIIYKTALKRLTKYANNPKLRLIDVNYTLLEGFNKQLIKDGVKQNTISNYFRTLRAIYNKAIKSKLIERSHYPFLDLTIKTEKTAKRSIKIEELIKLNKLSLQKDSQEWHARNYFLLSFALRGASFTDLAYLKKTNIKKGYIVYKRRKTSKELKIKLLPFTSEILNHYKYVSSKYLLPVLSSNITEDSLKAKAVIYQWIKTSNKYLDRLGKDCNIDEDITSYVSRHTFATVAKKKLGYSNEIIAECLGHEYGNKITNIYLDDFDQCQIDEVNERVVNLLE